MKEKKKEKMENRHMERKKNGKRKRISEKKECASIFIISCNILFVSNVVMYHAMWYEQSTSNLSRIVMIHAIMASEIQIILTLGNLFGIFS